MSEIAAVALVPEFYVLIDLISALSLSGRSVAGGVLGAILGSFMGLVLVRLPQGRSLSHPRSACDSCGRTLSVRDLIPVISYVALRGRCRSCGTRIDPGQFQCECAAALTGALPWLVIDDVARAAGAMVLGWLLLLLALLDWRHFWLPRRIVAGLGLCGVAFLLTGQGVSFGTASPAVTAVAGGALGFGLLWLVRHSYRILRGREGMGAGDAPLLGAIGLWVGPEGVILTLLAAALLGLLAALALHLLRRPVGADTKLPLGTFLALAAWPVFLIQTV